MKKLLSRLVVFMLLACMCIPASVEAQHRHGRPQTQRRHNSGDGFYRAVRNAEAVGRTAMFGALLHQLDDYTGFRIGYNSASLRTDLCYSSPTSEFTSGFNAGFVFGWNVKKSPVIIEPGIYYSMKGGKINGYFDDGYRFTNDVTMHSIEIPLVVKFHIPLTQDRYVNLQPFVGGFVSFGFAGETKYKEESKKDVYKDVYKTYGDKLFCTTDAGLRMGAGLAAGRFYFEVAYDLGLVNLPENGYGLMDFDNYSDSMRSNTVSFNIGVNF